MGLSGQLRLSRHDIGKERADGCQSRVARPDGIAAILLEVVEEREDELGLEVIDPEPCHGSAELLRRVTQQKAECIPIAHDRVAAGIPLGRQVLREERGDEGGEGGVRRRHGATSAVMMSPKRCSMRRVTSPTRSRVM